MNTSSMRRPIRRIPVAALAVPVLWLVGCGEEGGTRCGYPNNTAAGVQCTVTWPSCSDGYTYEVECVSVPPSTTYRCRCRKSTVEGATYSSDGYCQLPADGVTRAANAGCGWTIEIQ